MQYTKEIMKINKAQSLVLWIDGNKTDNCDDAMKFVVCSHYDPSRPIGQQWDWGHYFNDIIHAMDYVHKLIKGISYTELCEYAESGVSYLDDNEMLEDFLEDRDINMSDEAKKFFCIEEADDEEEQDYYDSPETQYGWYQQDIIDTYRRER